LLVKIVRTPYHKNNIINIKKKSDDYINEIWANKPCLFQTLFYLVNVYDKKGKEQGTPFLTMMLQLISSDHALVLLNLEITFSYNLVTTTLNSKGTFISSNLFLRKCVKSFSKFNEIKQEIGFIIVTLLYNDPKSNKVVHS
jgi:hypothetical protein